MKIAIANDHAATEMKFQVIEYLESKGHEVINFGPNDNGSCNYPEYGVAVGEAVVSGQAKYNLEYVHYYAFGGYMHRLAGTRRRSVNLYGGGGVFMGAEVLDPMSRLPKDTVLGIGRTAFLYGVYAGLSAEFFIVEKVAVMAGALVPLNFSSGIRMLNYDVCLGLKVML